MHMDIRADRLYVAEYLNDRIQIFSPEGESLEAIGESGTRPGQFDAPGGVAVAQDGRLYVADFYNHRVQVLSSSGDFVRQVGTTGESGRWAGLFNYPTDVALLPDGTLVVADAYNHRLQLFSAEGEFLRKWGGPFAMRIPGGSRSWFRTDTAVTTGENGSVFVADFYNHRVQKFSAEGEFLVSLGSPGSGPGQLDRPIDMAVDENGAIYVVDFGNHRIQKFEPLS